MLPGERNPQQSSYHLGVFTLKFKFHGKQVTRERVTCSRSATPECLLELLRLTFAYSLSLVLLCSSHREVIELRSRLQSSQPPLQWAAAFVQGVFALLGGCVCTEDKQTLLPGKGTERFSCVGQILWDSGPPDASASFTGLWTSENSLRSVMEVDCVNKFRSLHSKTNTEVCLLFQTMSRKFIDYSRSTYQHIGSHSLTHDLHTSHTFTNQLLCLSLLNIELK